MRSHPDPQQSFSDTQIFTYRSSVAWKNINFNVLGTCEIKQGTGSYVPILTRNCREPVPNTYAA
jgi:hypothetical protein